jgi:hypothetical protein
MRLRAATLCVTLLFTAGSALWCQEPESASPAMQQKLAELKRSVAANQARLHKYQWVQTTQVSIKGETKREQQQMCRYGPDGKVEKTPIGPPPPEPQVPTSGLRGKMAKKKVGEMKDYMDRLKSLISHYAPPDPQMIQAAIQAGNASITPSGGLPTITFTNYYKSGDKVSFIFDTAAKKLRSYEVHTYLDNPKDMVMMMNQFQTLPDGTNYLAQTILNAQAKQIVITTTNSEFTRVA